MTSDEDVTCRLLRRVPSLAVACRPLSLPAVTPPPHGRVLLSDFGFAAELDGGLTKLVGTPEYLAPEIVGNFRRKRAALASGVPVPDLLYDERVDLWSLGVLLYELFTGFPPFNSDDDEALYVRTARYIRRLGFRAFRTCCVRYLRTSSRAVPLHCRFIAVTLSRAEQASIVGDNGATLDFPDVPFATCSIECVALLRRLLEREPQRRVSGDALRAEADAWLESAMPTQDVFSSRPRHATATSIARGKNLKATGIATTACIRFALEGRQGAARCIQDRVRSRWQGEAG